MARSEKMRAIVLSRRSVGEADRLVTLFTRERGILRVLAKGVRRIPSRRGGHLEPLTHVLALITGRAGYYYVSAVETIDAYAALRTSTAIRHAEVVSQCVAGLFEMEEPQEALFDAFDQACVAWPDLSDEKQMVVEVALVLYGLRCAGVLPQLVRCQRCGTSRPTEAVVLVPQEGGWQCLSCHASLAGAEVSLSPRLLKATRWLAIYPERALQLRVESHEGQQLLASWRSYLAAAVPRGVMSGAL